MKTLIFLFVFTASVWSLNIQKAKTSIGGRIIGGLPAQETEFPYIAAIWKRTALGRYFCSGTVIGRQWILTAGHCVLDAEAFQVQLGSVNLTGSDINRITITAASFNLHPEFDEESFANNVGLIYLPNELRYNDYVNVIGLPTDTLPDNTLLTSVGWGQTDDDNSGPVESLNRVYVISMQNEHCRNFYGDQVKDNMVCASGSYNEGTCIGDIGGPLIQGEGDQSVLVGVASFLSGNGCESLDPSGYESLFNHLDWIASVTNITANYK